jgi:hypothetical protein
MPNIRFNFLLAGFRAGVKLVSADRGAGQMPRLGRQGFGVDDSGNVQAAMADINSEADFFSHHQLSVWRDGL